MSFQQGLSGLNAASKSLDVIGNNVANAGTYGAKSSRAEFADLYASALNGAGNNSAGTGVAAVAITQQFASGGISTTSNPLDVAIKGSGFFELTDGVNPAIYSRNGQFQVDKSGYLVTSQGLKLMGYPADAKGVVQPGAAAPLQLPNAGIAPSATTRNVIEMNLDSRRSVTVPAAAPLITFNDATTYNDATSVTVYDAKGQSVGLTYYFQKAAVDADGTTSWNVYATSNGATLAGTQADPQPVSTLVYPPNGGAPTAGATGSLTIPAAVDARGVATLEIPMTFNFAGSTSYGASSGVTASTQDGYDAGKLNGVTVESNGILTCSYSNGRTQSAGQLELTSFRNPQGLRPLGGNTWSRSIASGDPVVGVPGSGSLGTLQSSALEESNVDLTAELVAMMTTQRTYQANAQTIKTQDQVLQTLVNLR